MAMAISPNRRSSPACWRANTSSSWVAVMIPARSRDCPILSSMSGLLSLRFSFPVGQGRGQQQRPPGDDAVRVVEGVAFGQLPIQAPLAVVALGDAPKGVPPGDRG